MEVEKLTVNECLEKTSLNQLTWAQALWNGQDLLLFYVGWLSSLLSKSKMKLLLGLENFAGWIVIWS